MKILFHSIYLSLVLLACVGCANIGSVYPKTKITGYIDSKPFTFQAPKDYDVQGFDVSVDTNGAIHIHIDALHSVLNTTNINAVGSAEAQLITAQSAAIHQAVQDALAIAAQTAAAAAK